MSDKIREAAIETEPTVPHAGAGAAKPEVFRADSAQGGPVHRTEETPGQTGAAPTTEPPRSAPLYYSVECNPDWIAWARAEIARLREQEQNRWHEVELYQERNRELQRERDEARAENARLRARGDLYSELADALGSDPMDSHEGRVAIAKRLRVTKEGTDRARTTLDTNATSWVCAHGQTVDDWYKDLRENEHAIHRSHADWLYCLALNRGRIIAERVEEGEK